MYASNIIDGTSEKATPLSMFCGTISPEVEDEKRGGGFVSDTNTIEEETIPFNR